MKNLWYIAAGLLFLGALSLPSGYYDLLRWFIFGVALFAAYKNFQLEQTSWGIAFLVIALIFNPFLPLYLYDKFLWSVIDIGAALTFIFNSRIIKE
tara:strand:- start:357 stop:644 length:288 start_codon:yes stop_codon:yes gene_type:complete